MKPIRLLIVDDSELVRHGIRAIVDLQRGERRIVVVGEAATAGSGCAAAARLCPDVVLLDIRLPDGSGVTACRQILKSCPETCVLMLTSFASDELLYESVVAGARGYLMKEIQPRQLVDSILRGAAGQAVLGTDATERMMRLLRGGTGAAAATDLSQLTPQERRVLELVASGFTNKAIATELKLSENTVKNYLVSVFEKLRVSRRTQAAAIYIQAIGLSGTRPEQAM